MAMPCESGSVDGPSKPIEVHTVPSGVSYAPVIGGTRTLTAGDANLNYGPEILPPAPRLMSVRPWRASVHPSPYPVDDAERVGEHPHQRGDEVDIHRRYTPSRRRVARVADSAATEIMDRFRVKGRPPHNRVPIQDRDGCRGPTRWGPLGSPGNQLGPDGGPNGILAQWNKGKRPRPSVGSGSGATAAGRRHAMGKSSKTRRPYGSGSVRDLGDGRWEVQATCGRGSDGRRRRSTRVVRGSKADAEMELLRLRVEMGSRPTMGDAMTLGEYFWGVWWPERELALRRGGDFVIVRRGTLDTYRSVFTCYIEPHFGPWPADRIREEDVERWAMTLPTTAAVDKAFRHLKAILRSMWNDRLLDEEPLRRHVRLPRHQLEPVDAWTPDELMGALSRLRGHQMEGIALAIGGGGLRREEALALDLPRGLAVGTDGGHVVLRAVVSSAWTDAEDQRGSTKTHVARSVTIGEPFSLRLMSLASDGRPKLLMRRDGRAPLMPGSVPKAWRTAFRGDGPLHGMRYVELRTLRHTHETMSSGTGMSDAMVAKLHGHSQQVMYSHYLTVASSEADRLAEAIRRSLAGRWQADGR